MKDAYVKHIQDTLKGCKNGITASKLIKRLNMAIAERTVYNTLVKLKNQGKAELIRCNCSECGNKIKLYKAR